MGHQAHGEGGALSPAKTEFLAELLRLGASEALVAPSRLSEALGVSPPAVAKMAASLARHGLVERSRYRGIRLTRRGRHAAVRALRAHRLAEAFLVRVMGYGWHEAHGLADSLAGIADDRFVDEMEAKAGYPRRCPHGEPIPTRSGELPAIEDRPLEEAEIGWEGRVGRVRTRDPERLQYLASVGLVPDAPLAVVARAPFRGPVRVRVAGAEVVLGSELSRTVFVEERPAVPSTAA